MGFKLKAFVVVSSGLVLGVCTYAAYRTWKKRLNTADDEGFEDVSKLEETLEKKVLVLGLEGSGKSTLVSQIVKETGQKYIASNIIYKPTEGFNVTSLSDGTSPTINIWEIGGKESVRRYWAKFFQDTDILVFVVDASNNSNLSVVVSEIKSLLGDARLASVPILVLANKQDVVGALGAEQISNVLDLKSIPSRSHQVKVLETQTRPGSNEIHPMVFEVRKMFIVSEFEEVVKVHPTHLEDDQVSRIVIHLNSMLANKVVMDVGLCLSLFDILEIGDSIIYPSEGAYFSKVKFRFVVFRPFVEEILIGKVKSCCSDGAVLSTGFFEDIFVPAANMQNPSRFDMKDKVWVWEYDNCGDVVELHMDIGETVRFRVVSEQFVDTHPGVDSGLMDTSEIVSSKYRSPYSIVGTVREPGLGVVGWWTDL